MNAKWEVPIAALLALAFTVLAHGVAMQTPFLWDDVDVVTPGGERLKAADIPSFFGHAHWVRPHNEGVRPYRPLRDAWLALVAAVAGDDPRPYHLGNLLLQAANVVLVFLLARRLLPGKVAPRLAAAFFAVHPMHVEAVLWAKNAAELLALFLGLLAFLAFMRAVENRGRRSWLYAIPAALFYLAAVLTKESVLPLPAIMLLWAVTWRGGKTAASAACPGVGVMRALFLSLPLWAAAIGSAGYQYITTKSGGGAAFAARVADAGLWGRLGIFGVTVARYLRMLFLPGLNRPLHGLDPALGANVGVGAATLAAGALLAVLFALHIRRRRQAAYGFWWALLALGPVANLLAINGERPLAEQRLYMASVGAAMLLGAAFARLAARRRAALAGVLALILAWGCVSARAGEHWRTRPAFWRWAVRTAPEHRIATFNMGVVRGEGGRDRQALAMYRQTLRLAPRYTPAAYNLGNLLARNAGTPLARQLGKSPRQMYEEAAGLLEGATDASPAYAPAWNSLGFVYRRLGRDDEALACYREAFALDAAAPKTRENLAGFYLDSGLKAFAAQDYPRAADDLRQGAAHARAAGRWPEPVHFLAWAEAWVRLGDPALAADILRAGCRQHPGDERLQRRLTEANKVDQEAE